MSYYNYWSRSFTSVILEASTGPRGIFCSVFPFKGAGLPGLAGGAGVVLISMLGLDVFRSGSALLSLFYLLSFWTGLCFAPYFPLKLLPPCPPPAPLPCFEFLPMPTTQFQQQLINILLMLDYYFCEECETYHQPNRLINGEILSACQCEISTEPSLDQIPFDPEAKGKMIRHLPYKQDVIHIQGSKSPTRVQYESPRIQRQGRNMGIVHNSGVKFQNMPFVSIIDEENRDRMRRFIMPKQQVHYNSPAVFMSPRKVKQDVVIRKSVSPLARSQRTVITQAFPQPRIGPPTQVKRVIPIQEVRPTKVLIKTPIQTITNIAFPQQMVPSLARIEGSVQAIEQPPYIPPSIKIINEENEEVTDKYRNRITLDRVSGSRSPEEEDYQYKGQRISLDRVTEQKNVQYEGEEEQNFCGKCCVD